MITYHELWPTVVEMPRVEKFRLLQALVGELAQAEACLEIPSDIPMPIWSPYDSYEAAATLMEMLEADKLAKP